MASTTSSLLKLELQTTGENSSTWGNKLNDTLSQAEIAITGEVTVSMAGSANVTLTDVDFSASQSRYAVLRFTGAITASVKAICPARVKWFYAINTTTQSTTHTYSMSVGTSSGTAVAIPNHGLPVLIYCDGTNCVTPQTALPSCHTATSTDTSLTTSIVVLPIAAADIVSDPYSMISTAANTVIIPAGVELMLVQLNIFSDITDDTTGGSYFREWSRRHPWLRPTASVLGKQHHLCQGYRKPQDHQRLGADLQSTSNSYIKRQYPWLLDFVRRPVRDWDGDPLWSYN
jgi:hypothetical protein